MTSPDSFALAALAGVDVAACFTMAEVTEICDCSAETIVARIEAGELVGVKFGRGWIFPRAAFLQRLNDHALEVAQQRRAAARGDAPAAISPAPAPAAPAPSARVTPRSRSRAVRRVPPVLPIPSDPQPIEQVRY